MPHEINTGNRTKVRTDRTGLGHHMHRAALGSRWISYEQKGFWPIPCDSQTWNHYHQTFIIFCTSVMIPVNIRLFKFLEILGALLSTIIIWMVTGALIYLASLRLLHPDYNIDATVMLITSACAVIANILLSLILHQTGHGHSHGSQAREHVSAPLEKPALSNVSLRAAFVHSIGDLFQSLSVLISALIVFFKVSFIRYYVNIFSLLMIYIIIYSKIVILILGTSKGFAYDEVKARILAVERVESVHNLHLWSLTMNQTILSAHVATADTEDSQKILRDITQALFEHYSFHSITIQIESGEDQKHDCVFCQEPRD
uniref:Proton-coupled zinc antiporter SLC30A8 n=1 Tax=Amazona collaria TaxID=241587 RepID=A0A8B9ITB0_9PSIT